jgi:hypothetical protein
VTTHTTHMLARTTSSTDARTHLHTRAEHAHTRARTHARSPVAHSRSACESELGGQNQSEPGRDQYCLSLGRDGCASQIRVLAGPGRHGHPHVVAAVLGFTFACQMFVAILIKLVHRFKPSVIRYPLSALYPADHLMLNTGWEYFPWQGYCFVVPASCSILFFVLFTFLGPRFVFGLCAHLEVDDRGDRWVSQPLNCSLGPMDAVNDLLRSVAGASPV